jgi:hypothetical protein
MHLIPELRDDAEQLTTQPSSHDTSLFGDIPRWIWTAFLSGWALLFALFLAFFTKDGPTTLAVLTATFFALMILGLPAALGTQSKFASREPGRTIHTRSGPLPVGAAATQILLIPVASVIGVAAFIVLAM